MAEFTLIIGNKNYSSWSLRAWLPLKHIGVDFEEVKLWLDTPEFYEVIDSYSPSGRVPVLRHGGRTLWESIAICEYIAELFPEQRLLPESVEARAIARCVSAEMHAGFVPLRQNMSMRCRDRRPGEGMAPGVQANIDRITSLWRSCREQFGTGGDFLFGHFTIADAMYAPVVSRFVTYGVTLDPVSQAYADAIWALPAMQDWLAAAEAEPAVIENSKL
ncbi:MAG TPA: glutathione S-transferase family protein [Chroococcidiopsis sp.]